MVWAQRHPVELCGGVCPSLPKLAEMVPASFLQLNLRHDLADRERQLQHQRKHRALLCALVQQFHSGVVHWQVMHTAGGVHTCSLQR